MKKAIITWLEEDQITNLKSLAGKEGRPLNNYIQKIVSLHLEDKETFETCRLEGLNGSTQEDRG